MQCRYLEEGKWYLNELNNHTNGMLSCTTSDLTYVP